MKSKTCTIIKQRAKSFHELGSRIHLYLSGQNRELNDEIEKARANNAWFTKESVDFALAYWEGILDEKRLSKWCFSSASHTRVEKNILVLMAGNIPLVGFHDALSVLLSGHRLLAKISSKDQVIRTILSELIKIDSSFKNSIEFVEDIIQKYDAVIATGSNYSSLYFERYFGNRPMILRKSRTSIAILDGNETKLELDKLAKDIFIHFGLGCRNVTKLYLPNNFDLDRIFKAVYKYRNIINHNKYCNNYDYYKALFLTAREAIWDNEFLILRDNKSLFSPVSVVHYEYYNSLEELRKDLNRIEKDIQCFVTHLKGFPRSVSFGETQTPQLDHYADGVDTLKFLGELHQNGFVEIV